MSAPDISASFRGDRATGVLLLLAGLSGGLGVALSAMAAHVPGGELLSSAANMLLFHAPAFLALAALAALRATGPRGVLAVATLALAVGLALFAGDLTSRVMLGDRLFPMAAPTGGSLMILGWAGILLAGAVRLVRRA
ncbi:DUF423 domain-containing protein [Stappia sp. P2PMeth1]|uniref:DUF423 domain-containing protein n=1 Tax=Stappia sp. P2PMeth1 TaxID=2003586 RepID=UPI00164443D6|nr:DUF423 domain-containing protein [Stappia sp. P2PMeth1]